MQNNDKFEYTYFAPTAEERKRIESIRREYEFNPSANKMKRLELLDKKVKRIPKTISITVGVFGTLILGFGLSMIIEWENFIWGVLIGMLGLMIIGIAFPVYCLCTKKYKAKHSEEILRLIDELLKNEK